MNKDIILGRIFIFILVLAVFSVLGCGQDPETSSDISKNIIVIGARGSEDGYFILPRTVAYSKDENVFFATDKSGRIQKFTEDGKFIKLWRVPFNESLEISKRGYPAGIDMSPDNKLYVCDSHQGKVVVYDTNGKKIWEFGCLGTEFGQYGLTGRMAFVDSKNYYVSDYKSDTEHITYYKNQKPERVIGKTGRDSGEFMRSIGICLDGDQNLYVSDANNHRVQVFDKDGKFLRTFGTKGDGEGQLLYPYGIEYDPEQDVLIVCEYGNSRLSFFGRDGKFLGTFGTRGYLKGEFIGIWDIAIGKNFYYVPDYNNNRIQIICKDYLRSFIKKQ